MSDAGDAAVLARLRYEDLANAVFDGTVTDPPQRYARVFSGLGIDSGDRLAGPDNVNATTYTIYSCGLTVEQAKWVARRVRARMKDWEPFPGQGTMTHPVSREPQVDRDSNPPLWFLVDQYDLTLS